jgi:glycosyltransferase involved in cell wall biosynthesis
MKNKKLVVLESIHLKPIVSPGTNLITTGELGQWVRSGTILSQLFRYNEVCLLVSQHHLLSRPFLCALTLRLVCYGKCFFKDIHGTTQPITWITLWKLFFDFLRDFARVFFRLRHHQKVVRNLESALSTKEPKTLKLKHPPLYLRTDLFQGLVAGGSLTHTAGVVNALHHFTLKPVILTTVQIPGLKPHSIHKVELETENRNFTDIFRLESNNSICQQGKIATEIFSFIYHRHSPYNYSGVLLARHFGIPLVIEYNSPGIWVGRNWTQGLRYERLAEKIELLNFQAASVVVVVSQPLKNMLVARKVEPKRILVNPNGVDPEIYSPKVDGSNIRRKYNLQDKTVIGFIGTFGKWHGAEILAQAFGLLLQRYPQYRNSIRLLMIGNGHTAAQVQQELETYNVTQECVLTGIVPQEEGPAHLAACNLLVSPHVPNPDGTPCFGSPTKLFEYMAMGKGIIASDLDQIGEVLKHNQTAWMVKPGDANSLMLGLKTMIDNLETSKRLGEAARQEVVSKYTWKEHTRKIIEKLKEQCHCN